jgi:prophage antirepressor-like protein
MTKGRAGLEELGRVSIINIAASSTKEMEEKTIQSIFDFVSNSYSYDNNVIRTYLLNDTPWFCGKDIANILGFKDTDQTLRKNVDNDDKIELETLFGNHTIPVLETGIENYNKRDLKMIYINESGLYSLVLKSRIPSANAFKNFVTKKLLPAVRKAGIDKYIKELNRCRTELEEAKNKNLSLVKQIQCHLTHDPDGWIYIATNKQYSTDNHYRIGRTSNLENRLRQYNIGRTKEDKLCYVYTREVAMVDTIELNIRTLLKEFRESPREDMYILDWALLRRFVDSTCDKWNMVISDKNTLIQDNLGQEYIHDSPSFAEEIKETPVDDDRYKTIFFKWFEENFKPDEDCYVITLKRVYNKFRSCKEYNSLKIVERKNLQRNTIKGYLLSAGLEFHEKIRQSRNELLCSVFVGYSEIG